MSLLPRDTFVNANRQLYADQGSGGGGGGSSTLQSPATITPTPTGAVSLSLSSSDAGPATLTVTTVASSDFGAATVLVAGGTNAEMTVTSAGAGPAVINVEGGTAGSASVNLQSQAGEAAEITMGPVGTQCVLSCDDTGELTVTPSISTEPLITVQNVGSANVIVSGLKLVDVTSAAGAITGQNILGPSPTPLNSGVPVNQTTYPLPNPGAAPVNVGWWLYSTGTTETGAPSINSIQSSLSVMAYWNGTTFSKGGNMMQVLDGTGGFAANYFAQFFLSLDRTQVCFFFNQGAGVGTLATMTFAATQMTGAQAGF